MAGAFALTEYFFRLGYRRGAEYVFRYAPTFEAGYSRLTVHKAVVEYEKEDRIDPVFWGIQAALESNGNDAMMAFERGIVQGILDTMKANFMSRFDYSVSLAGGKF